MFQFKSTIMSGDTLFIKRTSIMCKEIIIGEEKQWVSAIKSLLLLEDIAIVNPDGLYWRLTIICFVLSIR